MMDSKHASQLWVKSIIRRLCGVSVDEYRGYDLFRLINRLNKSVEDESVRALSAEKANSDSIKDLSRVVAAIRSFGVVVPEDGRLPSSGTANAIYLVPSSKSSSGNFYDEYLWVGGKWELIGSTKIDLTDYAKKGDVPSKTSQLENDSGFLTKHQSLDGYVKDDESYELVKDVASKGASHAAIKDGSNPHGTTAGEIPYKDWSAGEALAQLETDIVKKRSNTDNICHEDSYGDWVFGGGAEGMSGVSVEFFASSEGSENGDWLISVGGSVSGSCSGKKNDTHLDFESYNPEVFGYKKPTADRKKVAKKDESFVTKSYVEGVAGELVKKPTADASTVVFDTENGCVLEVGTRNADVGGVLKVGQMSGGVIEVGSAKEGVAEASIKKNGKEVATENQLPYSHNTTPTLKDRAFNALSFDGTEYNLSTALAAVTPTVEGAPRDLLIVATASAATTISFTASTIKGDKPTIDGEGKWIITLTEYEPDTWYCRQIKMEDAQ